MTRKTKPLDLVAWEWFDRNRHKDQDYHAMEFAALLDRARDDIAALSRELEEARAQRVEANNQWRIDYNELALERDEAKWLLKQMVEPDLTEGGVWKPITVNTIRYDEAKRFLKEPALSRADDTQNTGKAE